MPCNAVQDVVVQYGLVVVVRDRSLWYRLLYSKRKWRLEVGRCYAMATIFIMTTTLD